MKTAFNAISVSLEQHPLAALIVQPQDFSICFANRAAYELYAYGPAELEGRNFLDLFTKENSVVFEQRLAEAGPAGFNTSADQYKKTGQCISAELYVSFSTLDAISYLQVSAVHNSKKAEQEKILAEENKRYKTYFEQSSAAIFCQELKTPLAINLPAEQMVAHLKTDGYISECNQAMAEQYGFSDPSELLGLGPRQLLNFSDPANTEYLRNFVANGFRIHNAESHEKDKEGRTRYFLNNAAGIVEEGHLRRIWGTQRDITERKKAEERARILANLVEQTSDVLTSADLDYKPLTWNKAAEKIYGLTAGQVLGKNVRDFIDVHYNNTSREKVRQIITEKGEWRGEVFFIRPTDDKLVTLILCFRLLKDENQVPLGYIVSGTDITERKEAESRLRESENRFREMANSAPVMIWMCNEQHVITYLNRKWLDFTGRDISYGNMLDWKCLLHPDDEKNTLALYAQAFSERRAASLVYRLLTKEGSFRWVKDVSTPRFLRDGTFIGYIGSVTDIEEQKRTEEQLRYQAIILENVSDIVFTTDLDFTIRIWNQAAGHYYGISEKEATGKKLNSLLPFLFTGTTFEQAVKDLQAFGIWEGETSFERERTTWYFLYTVKYIYDEIGNRIGFLAVGKDITERKKIEEQLQRSERFYRTLIADSLNGTLLINEEGIISFCSRSVTHMMGYEPDEIVGRNCFEFVHPDDLACAAESFQKEVDEKPEIKFIVVRLHKKSGDWLWCMVRGHNLLKNPDINSIVLYFHDDTLRKQATDALKESEKRFRTLIKDLQIGVLLQDGEGRILMSNRAMFDLFGTREEVLAGQQIWNLYSDVVHEDGRAFAMSERPTYRAMQTRQLVTDVVMGVWHPQKKERLWLLISANPILDENGQLRHIVCSFINISKRKKLEHKLLAEQISHQKQLTQATIDGQEAERREIGKELHDNIGQQLTTIKLLLDLIKANTPDHAAGMADTALKSVTEVINELRLMSRSLVPHTLKDLGLIDSITELIESIERVQSLEIRLEHADFEEMYLPENQKLTLFRIIQEQLNNIVKHAGAARTSVHLQTTIQSVVLEIKDDGRGFNPETIRKGLGLGNIRNRAELFGGKLEIFSTPGKGCLLKVSMPVLFSTYPSLTCFYN